MTITGSIKSLTNDGHTVAQFLVNTMEGQTDGVKVHHRLDAAKQLIKYGFSEDDSNFWGLIPTPEELASRSRDMEPRRELPKRKVTYLDILNFDIARQIRDETDDGQLMIEFLVKVMHGQQRPFIDKKQRIKPADRMAAAKELLNRGFGSFGSSRSRLSEKKDDYGTIHGDISQRIRQHTEYGSDITRFLLDVMAGQLHDDGFTMSHRVGAAKELLRRAYDINFDGVTWEQVEGYWRAQRPIGWNEEDERTLQNELAGSKPPLPLVEGRSEGAETPSPSASSHTIGEEPAHSESRGSDGGETPSVLSLSNEPATLKAGDKSASKDENADNKPPLPEGEGWGEGEAPLHPNISQNKNAPNSRRSRAHRSSARRSSESGNPERLADDNAKTAASPTGSNIPPDVAEMTRELHDAISRDDPEAVIRADAKLRARGFAPEWKLRLPTKRIGYSDPYEQIAIAAANGMSVICAPPADKLQKVKNRSP